MNRQETIKLLAILSSVWDKEVIDDNKVTAYQWALAEISYESAEQAVKVHLRTAKFFPKPAELLDVIADASLPAISSGEAWEIVQRQIRKHGTDGFEYCEFGDDSVLAAVRAVGWRRMCLDDNGQGYIRRDFDDALENVQRRRRREVQSGFTELLPTTSHASLPGSSS